MLFTALLENMSNFSYHNETEEDQVIYGVPEHYIGSLLPNTNPHFNYEDDDFDWRHNRDSQEDTEEDGISCLEVDSAYWRKKRRVSGGKSQDSERNAADRERIVMQGVFSMFAKYEQQPSQQLGYSQHLSDQRRSESVPQKPWDASSMASTLPSQQSNISGLTMSAEKMGAKVDVMGAPAMSGFGPSYRNPFTVTSVVETPYHAGPFNYDDEPVTIMPDGIAAIVETMDTSDHDSSLVMINPRKNLDFGQSPGTANKKLSIGAPRFSAIPSMNPLPRRSMDSVHTPRHMNRQVAMDSIKQTSHGEVVDLDRPAHWGSARKSISSSASAKKKQPTTPRPSTTALPTHNSSTKRMYASMPVEVPLPKSTMKGLAGAQTIGSNVKTVSFTPAWIRPRQRSTPPPQGGTAAERNAGNFTESFCAENIFPSTDDIVEDRYDVPYMTETLVHHQQGSRLSLEQHHSLSERHISVHAAADNYYHHVSPSVVDVNVSPLGKTRGPKGSAAKRSLLWRLQKLNREEEDAKVVLCELIKDPNNKSMQHLHPKNKAKLALTVEILHVLNDLDNFSVFKIQILRRICQSGPPAAVDKHIVARNDPEQGEQPILHPSSFLQDEEESEGESARSSETEGLLLLAKTAKQGPSNSLANHQHIILYEPMEFSSKLFMDPFLPIARMIAQADSTLHNIILGSTLWEVIQA